MQTCERFEFLVSSLKMICLLFINYDVPRKKCQQGMHSSGKSGKKVHKFVAVWLFYFIFKMVNIKDMNIFKR